MSSNGHLIVEIKKYFQSLIASTHRCAVLMILSEMSEQPVLVSREALASIERPFGGIGIVRDLRTLQADGKGDDQVPPSSEAV
jgi:hypothetical protein